jgi:dCTP deaminase
MGPRGSVMVDRDIFNLMDEPRPHVVARREDVRPTSLDLRIGSQLRQVAGIPSLGGGFCSRDFLADYTLNDFEFATGKLTLTPGNVYLVELGAQFHLPSAVWGYANPKSSAGRIDVHCSILAEGGTEFNMVPRGYKGPLHLLMVPQSFSIRDVVEQDFVQLRLYDGDRQFLHGHELEVLNSRYALTDQAKPCIVPEGLVLHLDLQSHNPANLVAVRSGRPISVTSRELNPRHYFREKEFDSQGRLFLDPGDFLLAATVEKVRIPSHICGEMAPFRQEQGEFRSHFAGFFDPGFGYGNQGEAPAATAVLEIRNIGQARIILSHGQPIALMRYEHVRGAVSTVYGGSAEKPSNYQSQEGVKLAKYFCSWSQGVRQAV